MNTAITTIQHLTTKSVILLETLKILFIASLFFPEGTHALFSIAIDLLPKDFNQAFTIDRMITVLVLFSATAAAILFIQLTGISFDIIDSSMTKPKPTEDDYTLLDKVSSGFMSIVLAMVYLLLIYKQSFSTKLIISSNLSLNVVTIVILMLSSFLIFPFLLHFFSFASILWNAINKSYVGVSIKKFLLKAATLGSVVWLFIQLLQTIID
ncbi:hypothetical protein [Candidatus Enterococcus ikei]|uniref:Yip1 domain-containing protein n=1 Tax=Candidatus Enterococcus ikei TaxID=2815326 RepID=A0ABS3H037_9ENTE|nr:hypothetical protein [Enterococcus sp. DIV0869a]MBO0440528.1 hypothetical protein [Enterococcus sp. DIV0869a]